MMRIIISSIDRHETIKLAGQVNQALRYIIDNILSNETIASPQILGPAPAAIERLKDRYRYHLLIKSDSAKLLSELAQSLNQWKLSLKHDKSFRIVVDIDPLEML
jgi:primosomal protein N' (replication factor Y)